MDLSIIFWGSKGHIAIYQFGSYTSLAITYSTLSVPDESKPDKSHWKHDLLKVVFLIFSKEQITEENFTFRLD